MLRDARACNVLHAGSVCICRRLTATCVRCTGALGASLWLCRELCRQMFNEDSAVREKRKELFTHLMYSHLGPRHNPVKFTGVWRRTRRSASAAASRSELHPSISVCMLHAAAHPFASAWLPERRQRMIELRPEAESGHTFMHAFYGA